MQDHAVVADDPALFPHHLDIGEVLCGAGLTRLPGAPGVIGRQNRATVAHSYPAVDVQERHGPQRARAGDSSLGPGSAFIVSDQQQPLLAKNVSN